jgi:type II secretory pathway pseudopilin PulG
MNLFRTACSTACSKACVTAASGKTGGRRQHGFSLTSLILLLAVIVMLVVLAFKIVPAYLEYRAINTAIAALKSGSSVREIQSDFDRRAGVAYITAISGKDLDIVKNGNEFDIAFAYSKKIPLFGPASLVLDYAGSTDSTAVKKAADDAPK